MAQAIFLLGGGGTGKTTLMDLYVQNHQEMGATIKEVARTIMREKNIQQTDLQNDDVFWDLQQRIARKQIEDERSNEKAEVVYMSDRCVIDALVYASIRFPERYPSLALSKNSSRATNIQNDAEIPNILSPLVGDIQTAQEIIGRYRRSLLVLVHPFSNQAAQDDGVRLVMSRDELDEYTLQCRQVLTVLKIPYVEIREASLQDRLRGLKKEIEQFCLPKGDAAESIA